MKKFNLKFVIMQELILLVVAIIPGVCLGVNTVKPVANSIGLSIFFAVILNLFYWLVIGRIITDKLAERTERKYSEERGYANCQTFYSSAEIFKVNVEKGKIAYIANQNPLEFQEISAAELTNVKSGYVPGPFGGTSYVYFEFMYQKQRKRIATFTSNQPYSLDSGEVAEALDKADYFCDVINQAKQNV